MVICLCTLHVLGVEIYSRKLDSSNGLPDNNVRNLIQDSKGFMWMGTPNGLYRYDGHFFTTFKYSVAGSERLLYNNHISGLYNIGKDTLLIAQKGNQFSLFDVNRNCLVEMPDQEKWQLYANIRRKVYNDSLVAPYRDVIAAGGGGITDNLGNVVVLDNTGLIWHIDQHTGETIHLRVFDETLFPLVSSKKYKVITSPKHNLIWISTNGCGITVYDKLTGQSQQIRQSSGLISTDYIVDMYMDHDENIWLADEFHGVVYLTTMQEAPEIVMLDVQAKGLRSNQVYIMRYVSDSTILVANTQGDVYKADKDLTTPLKPTYRGVDLHAVCVDKGESLWQGTRTNGLLADDNRWYKHVPEDPTSVSADNIYYLMCDQNGRVWVAPDGSYLDLAVRQPDGSYQFRHFFDKNFSARVLYQDRYGTMWVGTKNGVYCFHPDELLEDATAFMQPLTGEDLNYSDVCSIFEDSRGNLWVGTMGSGVYCMDNVKDYKESQFVWQTSVGLRSNEVQSILEDSRGVMWFATKNGLTSYNPDQRMVRHYYNEDNLMHNYYADNCALELPDGRLAFGTNSGILIYNPNMADMSEGVVNDRLDITGIYVNGTQAENLSELRLAHNENALTIRFSAFNYKDVSGVSYSYKLEGYDKEWSEPSIYSFATYKNLSPGEYVFRVKAYGTGLQSDVEKILPLTISLPWWRTWWACFIYIVISLIVAYIIYRQLHIVYSLRRRISIEKQLTEYKLQFFTNISHEFRTPLTIIRGALERIKGHTIPAEMRQSVTNMDKSVNRMLRLINQLLEFRKMQNNKLRLALEETDVVKYLRDIYQSFRDIAENKQITYTFSSQEKSRMVYIDRSHLDKVMYNLLSNAFKYTPTHGQVRCIVHFTTDKMIVRVEDTGVGVPKEKQPELFQRFMQSSFSGNSIGIGLNLSKALVEVHHGTIRFEPNILTGSIFIVEIPTDKSVYSSRDFLSPDHLLLVEQNDVKFTDYHDLVPQPMNNRKILIVEDDSDVIGFLSDLLQRYFVVHTAMDGVEALNLLDTVRPDLIVCDIMMPVMDGLEFTNRIRHIEEFKDTPIILLTALISDEKRLKAIENGADAYITKPFEAQLLIATVVQLIQQRDMLKDRYGKKMLAVKRELPEIITEERDKRLLDMLDQWLSEHMEDSMLSVDDVATAMGYRRTVFFKKMKTLTGQTPADYIKSHRMKRAAELLCDETITVSEVCYKVGISDPHYFAKVFKSQFGISPKKYQQGHISVDT